MAHLIWYHYGKSDTNPAISHAEAPWAVAGPLTAPNAPGTRAGAGDRAAGFLPNWQMRPT